MGPEATGVLLDCFGTLVALEPPVPALRAGLRELAGVEVSEDAARAAFRAEVGYYVEHHLEGSDREALDGLRDRCAEVIRAELGIGGLPLARVRAAMLGALHFHAFPDAEPALRRLRERRIPVVVASNWDVSLPEVLDRVGLLALLDGVVSSAEVGHAKPHPALFERALAVAGVAADRAVYVGDSVRDDAEGAAAAGIRAVLLARPAPGEYGSSPSAGVGEAAPALATIRSLEELPSVV
jgi:putative hydrolase of the HAD superfamily